MTRHFVAINIALLLATLLAGCSSTENLVLAPDTQPGDQLKDEYMPGKWCTDRELTSQANKDAGFSALTNVTQQFWRFGDEGEWDTSISGWLFESHGSWKLEGLDTLKLESKASKPLSYQARFEDGGVSLYLKDDEGKFLVVSRCED
jgi:hypothetical protein